MKSTYFLVLLILFTIPIVSFSQSQKVYNPDADANADIKKAIEMTQENNKHIFLQIGGNWCPWCIKFHNFVEADSEIKNFFGDNFEVVKVNYDRENKQEKLLAQLGFPQRFGFPVFVILDSKGNRIHTQNSAFLEKDKNYDHDIVLRFLKNWSPDAINPKSYEK
jgi:thioredoxin-related protein